MALRGSGGESKALASLSLSTSPTKCRPPHSRSAERDGSRLVCGHAADRRRALHAQRTSIKERERGRTSGAYRTTGWNRGSGVFLWARGVAPARAAVSSAARNNTGSSGVRILRQRCPRTPISPVHRQCSSRAGALCKLREAILSHSFGQSWGSYWPPSVRVLLGPSAVEEL